MKNIASLLSMAVVGLVLANCQAPLVSNQTASLRFSVTSPIASTNSVAVGGTSARLLDSTTNQIQLQIKDQTGAIVYQKTIPRNSQDIYQFSGLPNGIGFSVTLNAMNGTTIMTTATRKNVDLWAGKVNSVSMCLAPVNPSLPSPNDPIPEGSATYPITLNWSLTTPICASIKFTTPASTKNPLYRFSVYNGHSSVQSQCTIIAVNENGEVLPISHTNSVNDEWYISNCTPNSEITVIVFQTVNATFSSGNCIVYNN